MFDRFLVRALSDNLDSFHFHALLDRGVKAEIAQASGADERIVPVVSLSEIRRVHSRLESPAAFPRGVPGALQGSDLPDPLRGRERERPARGQAAQAVRRERPDRRADRGQRRRLLRAEAHLEQRRSGTSARGPGRAGAGAAPPRASRGTATRGGQRRPGRDPGRAGRHPRHCCSAAKRCRTSSCSLSCATCRTFGRRCRRSGPTPRGRCWPRSTSSSRAFSSPRDGPAERSGPLETSPRALLRSPRRQRRAFSVIQGPVAERRIAGGGADAGFSVLGRREAGTRAHPRVSQLRRAAAPLHRARRDRAIHSRRRRRCSTRFAAAAPCWWRRSSPAGERSGSTPARWRSSSPRCGRASCRTAGGAIS